MAHHPQRGTSLAELLVGLLIGLVVGLIVLNVLAMAEGVKRSTLGIADAQQAGTLAMFTLAVDVANAGHGLAAASRELATCGDPGDIRTSLRPIPVLIVAGANATAPDALVTNYGVGTVLATPMPFAAEAPVGANFRIRSPTGFAVGDALVAIGLDGRCAATTATTVSLPDPNGVVEIAHDSVPDVFPATSVLLDLGPKARVQRVRYDVVDGTLRSLELATAGAAPNPLASDVVTFKAQYGIDTDDDGFLDTWVSADAPPWNAASVLAAPAATLARIKAVRFGLIVRSDTFDRDLTAPFAWVLFDCGAPDPTRCAGRLTGMLPPKWRYRTYETVVPLRNAIWNGRP